MPDPTDPTRDFLRPWCSGPWCSGVPLVYRVWRTVTGNSRYREFFIFFVGIETGIEKKWYRKKGYEPVSEKIGTGEKSWNLYRKKLLPELKCVAKILEFWRFISGTGTVWVQVSGIFIFCGGMGTGIGKIRYRKTFSEPVSVKFGIGTGIEKIWYRKKYRYLYRKYLVLFGVKN